MTNDEQIRNKPEAVKSEVVRKSGMAFHGLGASASSLRDDAAN
jgi:hypothetical protein